MRDLAKADKLLDRARGRGPVVELLTLDVDDDASVAAAVGAVEDRHGAIDILVNNAGIDYTGSVETIDFEQGPGRHGDELLGSGADHSSRPAGHAGQGRRR